MSDTQTEMIKKIKKEKLKVNKNNTKKNEGKINALQLVKGGTTDKRMLAVYFPTSISKFIKERAKGHEYNIPFNMETIRRICMECYPDIIYMRIDWSVIEQQEPWLYLNQIDDPEDDSEIVKDILYMIETWLNGFEGVNISCSSDLRMEEVCYADYLEKDGYDRLIESCVGEEFITNYDSMISSNLLQLNYTRKGENKTIHLPLFWKKVFVGGSYSLISQPLKVKYPINKEGTEKVEYCFSYYIKLKVDNNFKRKRMNVYIGVTRMLQDPIKNEEMDYLFHKSFSGKYKDRTLYCLIHKGKRSQMLPVPVRYVEKIQKPMIRFDKTTEAFLKRIQIEKPKITHIFNKPSDFHISHHYDDTSNVNRCDSGYFIPYVLEDFGGNDRLNSGVSTNEHKELFNLFAELSSFPVVIPESKVINVKESGLRGSSIRLDTRQETKTKLVFEVVTDKQELFETDIRGAIHHMTKSFEKQNGEILVLETMPGKYNEEKTSINRFSICKEVNKGNELQFHLRDNEFPEKDLEMVFRFISNPGLVSKLDDKKGEFKRIVDIQKQFKPTKDLTFTLVDMDHHFGKNDPKEVVQKGLLEVDRLSKNIVTNNYVFAQKKIKHYENELKRNDVFGKKRTDFENKLKHWEKQKLKEKGIIKNKIRTCLYDLISRAGFYNQMIHAFTIFAKRTYYFPYTFEQNGEYLFTITRIKNGIVNVAYSDGKWHDTRNSLLMLKEGNKKGLYSQRISSFPLFIKKMVEENGVVLFLPDGRELFQSLNQEYQEKKISFLVGYLDSEKFHNPFIYKEKDGEAIFSKGFLLKDEHIYYSVPPKPTTYKVVVSENKQNINFPYLSRIPMKIELCEENIEIAEDLHRLRNISLTYDGYVSYPVPIFHLMKYNGRFHTL